MGPRRRRLRAAALMAVAALALHELRYLVGYGEQAGDALDRHGHAYLSLVGLVSALLLAVAAGQLVAQLARARREGEHGSPHRSLGLAWAAASIALLSIYTSQELLEGLFSAGHPSGIAGIVGHGGGWALPLALLLGGAVVLALQGVDAVVRAVSRPAGRRPAQSSALAREALPARVFRPRSSVLSRHLAGRAPPLPS